MTYRKLFALRQTPQNQPIPGSAQTPNSAGGFAWAVNDWTRLERFLVLGSEGGTYYINEQKLTQENAEAVLRCIAADGPRVVQRIVAISTAGRAPKNDPALFALALCASVGDPATRQAALVALPQVARIGTHLFHFLDYVDGCRGWGRGLRRAVAAWYNTMPAEKLAYQAVKYQQRDGWRHRDALRLAHPKAASAQHNAVYHWLTAGWPDVGADEHPDVALRTIWAFERAQRATTEQEIITLITQYHLPWEALPTQWLASAKVWQTLLPHLPLTALLRNLARMTANGALTPLSRQAELVVQRITDAERLAEARIHPIAVLAALQTYAQGKGARGSLKWEPVQAIVDALDRAFYLAFRSVEPTNKRLVLALDVSGSMGSGLIAGVPGLTPRVASAAMALVTAAVEKRYTIVGFSTAANGAGGKWGGGDPGLTPVRVSPQQRLDQVVKTIEAIPMGGTDCALPMLWALEKKVQADAFVIYTDSETWANPRIHPTQALQEYRRKMGIAAKLVVVAMTSNGFSIADPNDAGMLDVVGFDLATPQVLSDFVVAT
ncbi:MAG: TROVE domain-containing protein [Caldilineaceae bacterium]